MSDPNSLSLEPGQNYIFSDTPSVRMVLFGLGYANGLPNPVHHLDGCGVSICLRETETHYAMIFRHCNCEEKENGDYSAFLMSKETNTLHQAMEAFMVVAERNKLDLADAKRHPKLELTTN